MKTILKAQFFKSVIVLLRWNKPSGRLILLIPACWSLWLTPSSPPKLSLFLLIIFGGLFTSAAGCIVNDLWDKDFDKNVARTQDRPLAKGTISIFTATFLLLIMLMLSLWVLVSLPIQNRILCFWLALMALPPILLYPSAKRWFAFPQAFLSLCWGFSVLIPWAASEGTLQGEIPLWACWLATLFWTFGFDTVYAMADKDDDRLLGLKSSVLSLKDNVIPVISLSYFLTIGLIALAAFFAEIGGFFWLAILVAFFAMQREISNLKNRSFVNYGKHFQNQVLIGGLLLFGLILG